MPRQMRETRRPVEPTFTYFIAIVLLHSVSGAARIAAALAGYRDPFQAALPGSPGILAGDQVRDLTAMIVWWSSSAVFLKAHRFIVRYEGRIGSMKHPADLLCTIGVALTGVASVLHAISLSDQPDGARRLTWRARFVAANRRHPRLRGVAMACLAVALIA